MSKEGINKTDLVTSRQEGVDALVEKINTQGSALQKIQAALARKKAAQVGEGQQEDKITANTVESPEQSEAEKLATIFSQLGLNLGEHAPKTLAELYELIALVEEQQALQKQLDEIDAELALREKEEQALAENPPVVDIKNRTLTQEEVRQNMVAIENGLSNEDKLAIMAEVGESGYNQKVQERLAELATQQEAKKENSVSKKIFDTVKRFRKTFWGLAVAGLLTVGVNGFTADGDGHLTYDYKKAIKFDTEKLLDPESAPQKVIKYIKNAPWTDPSQLDDYVERVLDTKARSEGEGIVQAAQISAKDNPVDFEVASDSAAIMAQVAADVQARADSLRTIVEQDSVANAEQAKIEQANQEVNKVVLTLGGIKSKFKPTTTKNLFIGEVYFDAKDGLHGRSVIDMTNGVKVKYEPRNEKGENRTTATGVALISDYLYDMDFTDGYQHEHAHNSLQKLRQSIENKDFSNITKFVQVREKVPNTADEYVVKVKPVTQLTAEDFDQNKIYRQGWARLSDCDISADKTQIRLTNYHKKLNAHLFKNQGLPFHSGANDEHNLRVSGGVGNYDRYQNIADLNLFGAYLGGTVIVISDDGKIVRKVTGSVKDIITIALAIQKQTGGKEVHFLQSDSGSMNVKAIADKSGTIDKAKLGITRNQEEWAGASEILLKDQNL